MNLILRRNAHTLFGTFGELSVGDQLFYTVEQDWEGNKPFKSCIPNGAYAVELFDSAKHGASLIIYNDVLGVGKFSGDAKRFGCLIHKANLASELQGCIAPGTRVGFYKGQWCVSNSTAAMNQILLLLDKDKRHTLDIVSEFPSFIE
jgi:hypothetical protein